MKTLFSFCLLLSGIAVAYSQGFELNYGTAGDDWAIKVLQIPNENEVLTLSTGLHNNQPVFSIVKADAQGNLVWEKHHPFNSLNFAVKEASDGFWVYTCISPFTISQVEFIAIKFGYNGEILQQQSYSEYSRSSHPVGIFILNDYSAVFFTEDSWNQADYLFKLSPNGQLIWKKTFNIPGWQYYNSFKDMHINSDGSIVIVGWDGLSKTILAKMNADGDLLWTAEIPIQPSFEVYIRPFPDGNAYLVYGETDPSAAGNNGVFLAGVSDAGQVSWNMNFSDSLNVIAHHGVIPGENNTLYLSGIAHEASYLTFALFQINDSGEILWSKKFHEFQLNNAGQLLRDADGGFILAAESYPLAGQGYSSDPYVAKLSPTGEVIWTWHTANLDYYLHKDAILTNDGHVVVLGSSKAFSTEEYQNYLIKIDPNGVVYRHLLQGRVVFDENSSCTEDPNETGLSGWVVKAEGHQTRYGLTDSAGYFFIRLNADTAKVTVLPISSYWNSCPPLAQPTFQVNAYDTVQVEFMAQAAVNCPDIRFDLSTPFLRRCFENVYSLRCCNEGTETAQNVTVTVVLDSRFDFVGSSWPLYSQSGDTLIFVLGNLAVNSCVNFKLTANLSCEATLGELHCLQGIAKADNNCPPITIAAARDCQPNIGSFDPNDKRAFSRGILTERFIPADSLIEYHIRFQNTGTDTAFQVVIADTLSSYLDLTTIRLGVSSHSCSWRLTGENIVQFVFNNILLPDSNRNEPASHGFVKFGIRPKEGLQPGQVIPNRAAIYFDFNKPVITNTLALEIGSPLATFTAPAQSLVKVYPQPSAGKVWFHLSKANPGRNYRLALTDVYGRERVTKTLAGDSIQLDNLSPGWYGYQIWENERLYGCGKIVVVR